MLIIPSTLPGIIENAGLSRIQANNVFKLIGYIINRYAYHKESFTEPLPISQRHFRGNLGTHYNNALRFVKENNLLFTNDKYFFHPGLDAKGECKKYVLNPELIFTDPKLIKLENLAVKITGDFQTVQTAKLLTSLKLSIDTRKITQEAAKVAQNQFNSETILLNSNIPEGFYKIPGRKTALKLSLLRERADTQETDLIYYRGKCYLDNIENFKINKIYDYSYQYAVQLTGIKKITNKKFLLCRRNTTNFRLDTNLTLLKSTFIPKVKFFGSTLVSIDLSNSQFLLFILLINNIVNNTNNIIIPIPTLLTHYLIKRIKKSKIIDCKSDSYKTLEKWVKTGKLYEKITEEINEDLQDKEHGTWGRDLTKKTMFQVLFSSYRNRSTNKKILKIVIPELVWLADNFKLAAIDYFKSEGLPKKEAEKKGNNYLPITLQRLESKIFIDIILPDLLKRGLKVFTKHDSVLCRQGDYIAVLEIIRGHLDTVLGFSQYSLKTENAQF